jgi:hypothetical protein
MRRRLHHVRGGAFAISATMLFFCPCASADGDRSASPAAAPEDVATAQARDLFNEGTDRARRGDWSQALTAFERSRGLRPHAVTTYNVGYCERALGRYTRARKMFGKALADNAAHGGVELPDNLATAAKGYLAELERQIARAVITLSPEGASVSVDGRPLERAVMDGPRPILWADTRELGPAEAAAASTFELHIDPGTHVFVVSRPGYPDVVTTRTFDPGSDVDVVLALSAPLAARAAAPSPPPGRGESAGARGTAPSRLPLYVALGVGGAGLATGLIAGGVALGIKDKGVSHYAQAGTPADVSTAAFVVGGIGVVVSAIYWWFSLRGAGASAPPTAASGSAAVGPRGCGGHGVQVTWATPGGGWVGATF